MISFFFFGFSLAADILLPPNNKEAIYKAGIIWIQGA